MRRNKQRIKGSFFANILTLMTGTSIAQAVPIGLSPILTRIYTPDDFGVFALYVAIVSVVCVIVTGRYEVAIMLPKKDSDAANIVILSMLISVAVSLLVLAIVFVFNKDIVLILGNPAISLWLYFIPISIFLSGMYQSLNYWCNRNKQYKRISLSNITQSSSSVATQIMFGISQWKSGGLIVGNILGSLIGVFSLLKMAGSSLVQHKEDLCVKDVIENAKRYKKFPLFSWGALLNNAATQVPVFIISKLFGASVTGFYGMAFKILNMPLSLISGAISQVMFQRVSTLSNEHPELLRSFVLKIFLFLVVMAIPMVLVLTLYGEDIFAWIFGSAWAVAGYYASILSIALAVKFSVSPLSCVLMLDHNLKKGVLWQGTYFFTIVTTLMLASDLKIASFLKVLVVHEFVLYGVYLMIILRSTKYKDRNI